MGNDHRLEFIPLLLVPFFESNSRSASLQPPITSSSNSCPAVAWKSLDHRHTSRSFPRSYPKPRCYPRYSKIQEVNGGGFSTFELMINPSICKQCVYIKMKHFVLWGMDVENTWRNSPLNLQLTACDALHDPEKTPKLMILPIPHALAAFNVFDGPFRGNGDLSHFPIKKSSPPSRLQGKRPSSPWLWYHRGSWHQHPCPRCPPRT